MKTDAPFLIVGLSTICTVKKISITCVLQVNLDMTDSMGPGKLVRHMQNLLYTYDEYMICIGLGPSISSVICKNMAYSGPSYPSSPVLLKDSLSQKLLKLALPVRPRAHSTPLLFDTLIPNNSSSSGKLNQSSRLQFLIPRTGSKG